MALEGKIPVNELSSEQQQALARMLWQSLEDLDGSDVRTLQEIQRAGGSIYGLDKLGNIKKAGPLRISPALTCPAFINGCQQCIELLATHYESWRPLHRLFKPQFYLLSTWLILGFVPYLI